MVAFFTKAAIPPIIAFLLLAAFFGWMVWIVVVQPIIRRKQLEDKKIVKEKQD